MRPFTLALSLAVVPAAEAVFTMRLSSDDIARASTFNTITSFEIEITIDAPLVAGGIYNDPALLGVDYRVNGSLPNPTPSGFPGFALNRSIPGNSFYSLSPEATVNFSVSPTADLSDGLQFSELAGTGTVFTFDAREFDQSPGRYHPPVVTLEAGGTGRLANSNNMSTFPNPAPPAGSGMLVDVSVGEEYDNALTFSPALTIAVPEPAACTLAALALGGILVRRRHN